jgi:hypothetical protein
MAELDQNPRRLNVVNKPRAKGTKWETETRKYLRDQYLRQNGSPYATRNPRQREEEEKKRRLQVFYGSQSLQTAQQMALAQQQLSSMGLQRGWTAPERKPFVPCPIEPKRWQFCWHRRKKWCVDCQSFTKPDPDEKMFCGACGDWHVRSYKACKARERIAVLEKELGFA